MKSKIDFTESEKEDILSFLLRGFSTDEIWSKSNLHPSHNEIQKIIEQLCEVIYYNKWYYQTEYSDFNRISGERQRFEAIIHREIMVIAKDDGFKVNYFSMSIDGRHMRLVKNEFFSEKEIAIEYAKKIKSENS
ncbi:MAG: hypothetical protein GY839_09960 [candidate division Zixibacteria bacterium]|nr:hypothetical protein [candidate division Zixibacteria bacterium]